MPTTDAASALQFVPDERNNAKWASNCATVLNLRYDTCVRPRHPPPATPFYDKSAKFKLVPFEDIRFIASEEWLIKKLIPQQGVAVVYGSPGSFKSFVAMDLALHVALGWDWAGRRDDAGRCRLHRR